MDIHPEETRKIVQICYHLSLVRYPKVIIILYTWKPIQNGGYFTGDIFKIFLLIRMSQEFVAKGQTGDKSTLI